MFIIADTARARGEYRAEQQQRSEREERGDLAEGVSAGLCRGEFLAGKAQNEARGHEVLLALR